MNRILIALLFIGCVVVPTTSAAPRDFPQPAALEHDVGFWKRIYSEVGTDGGLIHDTHDLRIVYDVVKLPSDLSHHARERETERLKKKYKDILLRLAQGKRSGLSREEARVLALFDSGVSNQTLRTSADRIRFQLGQANKFRAGVIRSGAYKNHILNVLREMGLPLEIANLPHVESSYTPSVYSRVGAAGMWQFTRSTGSRFMQVDHIVDERLDPYLASIAAARLLEQNHRVTGSWPLAITAYNHGAAGMRRASQQLGTRDIVKIVREYKSRTFGFASRNFYVEFLAASAVASNAELHFGPLVLDLPIAYETLELPFYAKPGDIARAAGVDLATLKEANPALRPTVWDGSKYIPKGFELRLPRASLPRPLSDAIAAMPSPQRFAHQTRDASYVVQRGDTLSTIARRHGVRMSELQALNGLKSQHRIRIGQKLRLPTNAGSSTTVAYESVEQAAPKPSSVKKAPATKAAPSVLAALPEGGYYTVRRGDHLTAIAERFGIRVADLVAWNRLQSSNRIAVGQKLLIEAPTSIARTGTPAKQHPDATPQLASALPAEPAKPTVVEVEIEVTEDTVASAKVEPVRDEDASSDESATAPSPGLLADPSDYTVSTQGTILVQANETLGHYAEWLDLRASRLRQINGLRFGQPVTIQQKLKLDFSGVRPEHFERMRVEYHRVLQEEFFAEWEIEGTTLHRVGPGDSLWVLSTRRFDVPIWLLRQYNPDVDLEALSSGTQLTIPKLRQRPETTSGSQTVLLEATAG